MICPLESRPARRTGAALAAASVWFCAAAHAGPAITVYTRDLAFVRETRSLNVQGERDTVRIGDVTERIDFSSVRLVPEGGGRVTRLAYRFDVASGAGVLDRARGNRVRVTLRGDRVVEGRLAAYDEAWLVVREDDGSVHSLSRAAVEDVRQAGTPAELALRPTIEAVLEGRRGRMNAELSYLTGGLSWGAEHTLVRRGETGATWSSAVTVENTTGRTFEDARLKLVAGEPQREGPVPIPMAKRMDLEMSATQAAPDLIEQTFSEYHLYTLDRPATVRDRESQKLTMLEPRPMTVKPRYLYRGGDPRGVRLQLVTENRTADGLGVPLPAGRVRIYQPDPAGDLQFIGETRIGHTPEGEKLTLDVGVAFDLAVERRELYNRRISDREREYAVEIKLRNRKKTDVDVVVEENVGGEIEITQKTHEFVRKDANTLQFTIAVPAGKEAKLGYTARVRY